MNRSRMSTLTYAVIGAIVMFLVSATVFADQERFAVNREDKAASASDKFADLANFGHSQGRKWRVRCDRGEKLSRALYHARENDTIRFSGICYESVVIKTDNLSIEGYNGARLDGSQTPGEAVMLVDGARNLALSGFAVQNGSDQGILFTHQAQGRLSDVTAQNNGTVGLSVDRSHLEIENLVLDNNSTGGMDA
ncbi:MAG: hypothetical protein RLN69_05040 [Woeseiaceae bacterium]